MCDYTTLSHFLTLGLDNSQDGVESSPHLERSDPLEILTLEEEFNLRARRLLTLERGSYQGLRWLRGGRKGVQRLGRQNRGLVNIRLNHRMSSLDVLPRHGEPMLFVRHVCRA